MPAHTIDHLPALYMQGRKFKTAIHTAMSSSMFYNDKMLPYYNTADGKKLYDSLTQEAMLSFPQYVEEIQGLANGTGLPFYKVTCSLHCTYWAVCSEWITVHRCLLTLGATVSQYNGLQLYVCD